MLELPKLWTSLRLFLFLVIGVLALSSVPGAQAGVAIKTLQSAPGRSFINEIGSDITLARQFNQSPGWASTKRDASCFKSLAPW